MNDKLKQIPEHFYVVAREAGTGSSALPAWANEKPNPIELERECSTDIERVDIKEVPGAFQMLNVFSKEECRRFIEVTESLGYLEDAAVSLSRDVRHNDNITWIVDEETDRIIWQRCKGMMSNNVDIFNGKKSLGINARFRFYRYKQGDYFSTHTDGSWSGSRVINRQLIGNAYPDRWSQMTMLIFLSDTYEGGSTQFLVNKDNPSLPLRHHNQAKLVNVRTAAGSVLFFPHGNHPLHCLHSSEVITSGVKYIIRTDVLFEI